MTDRSTTPPDEAKVMVCDKCLRAACWYGEEMCQDAVNAGLKVTTVGELRKLSLEHEENWGNDKLLHVYGTTDRSFIP